MKTIINFTLLKIYFLAAFLYDLALVLKASLIHQKRLSSLLSASGSTSTNPFNGFHVKSIGLQQGFNKAGS